jgi:undecaprenyl diphosphate synthase
MNAESPSAPVGARRPRHIAIIMDGNGRWAEARRRPRSIGHRAGARAVTACIDTCLEDQIEVLTLFAFSSENWRRPKDEIGALMQLFLRALDREVDELQRRGVQVRFVGERAAFAPELRERMTRAEQVTATNSRLHLCVAANYGGRWDLAQAARTLAQAAAQGRLDPASIDESLLGEALSLHDLPAPDLFIRTGGDHRISNFLLWQLAYTELYFTDTLWPDFDATALRQAIADFAGRERRFGLTGAQIAAGAPP